MLIKRVLFVFLVICKKNPKNETKDLIAFRSNMIKTNLIYCEKKRQKIQPIFKLWQKGLTIFWDLSDFHVQELEWEPVNYVLFKNKIKIICWSSAMERFLSNLACGEIIIII